MQRLRIRVTPPVRDAVGQITTQGELKVQEIGPDGTVLSLWPASLVESIVDMRIVARPNGDSRVRVVFETGLEALLMETPSIPPL